MPKPLTAALIIATLIAGSVSSADEVSERTWELAGGQTNSS